VSLRTQLEKSAEAWQRFHDWEAQELPQERSAERIIADLGAILSWIPAETRLVDPDPEKTGVQGMHRALARMNHSR